MKQAYRAPRRVLRKGGNSGSGSASLFRFLLAIAVLLAIVWFFLESGKKELRAPLETEQAEDYYEEDEYSDEEYADEDDGPPPGAITGTVEELQDTERFHQERVESYKEIQ